MTFTRRATALAFALVVLAGLVGPSPAAGAAAPWKFAPAEHAYWLVPPLSEVRAWVTCPDGYVPVSGGITAVQGDERGIRRIYEYRGQGDERRQYYVGIRNLYDQWLNVRLSAECLDASALAHERIYFKDVPFTRDTQTSGHATGTVSCPAYWRAISGGADWNTFDSARTLDVSGVRGSTSFGATGRTADPANSLHIEVYCLPESDLRGAQYVTENNWDLNGTAACEDGFRVLTGGMPESGYQAPRHTYVSGPLTDRWTATFARSSPDAPHQVVAWCVPASQPVVSVTQAPSEHTNSTSATLAFSAHDPVGEQMTHACRLDDQPISPCQPGAAITRTVSEGRHVFTATSTNASQGSATATRTWTVDLTPPTTTVHAPTTAAPLTGPFTATFSETVRGVDASSFQVKADGSTTPLAGIVTTNSGGGGGTLASWRPAKPLVPGQTYRVSLGPGITDQAGNAFPPAGWTVRATTVVDSNSVALLETWDTDTSSAASGGAYRESKQVGARTVLRFTGTNVTVLGTRGPDGGLADVYLDGTKVGTASFYSSSRQWQRAVFTRTGLVNRAHTLDVRVLGTRPSGSSAPWVRLDAFKVGTQTYQESSSLVTSQFSRTSAGAAYGGSYERVLHQTSGDNGTTPRYTLSFRGTGVRVVGTKGPTFGTARIYIDGTLRATVNLRASSATYQAVLYTSPTLSNALHTLRIDAVGTSTGAGSEVSVDVIRIT